MKLLIISFTTVVSASYNTLQVLQTLKPVVGRFYFFMYRWSVGPY